MPPITRPESTEEQPEAVLDGDAARPDETAKPEVAAKPEDTAKPEDMATPDDSSTPHDSAAPDDTAEPTKAADAAPEPEPAVVVVVEAPPAADPDAGPDTNADPKPVVETMRPEPVAEIAPPERAVEAEPEPEPPRSPAESIAQADSFGPKQGTTDAPSQIPDRAPKESKRRVNEPDPGWSRPVSGPVRVLVAVVGVVLLVLAAAGTLASRTRASPSASPSASSSSAPSRSPAAAVSVAPPVGPSPVPGTGPAGVAQTPGPVVGGAGSGLSGLLPLPAATTPAVPQPVLPDLSQTAPEPSPQGVASAVGTLLKAPGLGSVVGAEVVDVRSGTVLLSQAAQRPVVPASASKILTGAAVLSLLGPEAVLTTSVVAGVTPDEVVLVGGGDVLLAAGHGDPTSVIGRAGLADLAAQTAQTLTAQGRTTVSVRLDDTLFRGPAVSKGWTPADVRGGFVAPVTALAVDAGNATPGRRPRAGEPFARVGDPAMSAAQTFARSLAAHGITVSGTVARAQAPSSGATLAQVRSAPLGDVVEEALTDSDNTVAEALARMVAVKSNRQATFTDAGLAVLDRIDVLGASTTGSSMAGGSGLGTGYALTPRAIVQVLALAASGAHPELRPVLTGLPVAGVSGTLADRFGGAGAKAALGVVRAKTGTLTGASSLAGTVVDGDGRLLAFAVLAGGVTSTGAARTALDAVAAGLAACGCR